MTQHIGIVGCSPPGAALCYQIICTQGAAWAGRDRVSPEVSLHTHSFNEYMRHINAGDWQGVAEFMLSSAEKLALAGADFCVAPCNTVHLAFEFVRPCSPLPWLHIAEEVAREALRLGLRRVALLGTKLLTESSVYTDEFARIGVECCMPNEGERERIDRFIFGEMVRGIFTPGARSYLVRVMERLHADGCDAVGMCCTELPILIGPEDGPLPLLDSTRILALAALNRAA